VQREVLKTGGKHDQNRKEENNKTVLQKREHEEYRKKDFGATILLEGKKKLKNEKSESSQGKENKTLKKVWAKMLGPANMQTKKKSQRKIDPKQWGGKLLNEIESA